VTTEVEALAHFRGGDFGAAAEAFAAALQDRPGDAGLWNNLAAALNECQRAEPALAAARRAVELAPDAIEALNNLGVALDRAGHPLEAAAVYRRALALTASPVLWNNLGNVLKTAGRMAEAVAAYREAIRLDPSFFRANSNLLLVLNYAAEIDADTLAAEHRDFGRRLAARIPRATEPALAWQAGEPLNVGFVSADFYNHPVGRLFLPVLRARANAGVRWHLYSQTKMADGVTAALREHADAWREIAGRDDAALERQVREDRIHVLVDLAGHTAGNRLPFLARHCVGVQAAWLGYAGTTGLTAMDWLIADGHTVPAGDAHLYSERIWRLPDSYIASAPPEDAVAIGPPPCLGKGHVTFAAFNNVAKATPQVIAAWAAILKTVPGARLLFKNRAFASDSSRAAMRAAFQGQGVAPERLDFERESPGPDYFAAYNRVDIALDPFPFTGLMTSLDTLWMGVPLVGMRGRRGMLSRHAELLADAVGAPEWLGDDPAGYVAAAVRLAQDPGRLIQWRDCLRGVLAASPLFDPARLAASLDAAFVGMATTRGAP
jgi:predicted O-linked N-acetylglucosamine transferase (SPINDLY family)